MGFRQRHTIDNNASPLRRLVVVVGVVSLLLAAGKYVRYILVFFVDPPTRTPSAKAVVAERSDPASN